MARKKTPQIVAEQLPEENIKPDMTVSEIFETIDEAMNAPLKEVETKLYIACSFRLWHPFQNKYISETPVELVMDGWLESQINAGLVMQCR
jgi:hypothetical protein